MKILITGGHGFIGKNLIADFSHDKNLELLVAGRETSQKVLDLYTKEAQVIIHLAGSNRPIKASEYKEVNTDFTNLLVQLLQKNENQCPILFTSSTQALLENPYGESKREAEEILKRHSLKFCTRLSIYRLPNVFGKWCRPNYNSAIATFCHNIARDLPVTIHDPSTILNLVYIDDVIQEFKRAIVGQEYREYNIFCTVPVTHQATLGQIINLLSNFKQVREKLNIPTVSNAFEKKLYSTYLSYLPLENFSYPLKMNIDPRGSFTEIIRTAEKGQFSVNISKPGITKGNHWHHTKVEKFLVVSGEAVIRFRHLITNEKKEYFVSGANLEVVDIPTGYTHNIENIGTSDLITFMWANEVFDPHNPDTFFVPV